MYPNSILIGRRILQAADVDSFAGIPETSLSAPVTASVRRPFNRSEPIDSSMALTILVLLTALFFLVFFSVYIRRFAVAAAIEDFPSPNSSDSHHRPPPPSNGKGLDASAVNSLPLVAYGKAAKHPMIDDCPICLSEFHERETVKLIPYCGHVFHSTCVDTWLASHVTCPLCRSAQLFKRAEEVCLDVTQDKDEIAVNEIGERATVEDNNTWRIEGSAGAMGICSCPNSASRAVIGRSTSF